MSSGYVDRALRRLVVERAENACEYCLIHDADTFFGCEVDHIISEKHGGATESDNLALACVFCNRHKGSDIATISSVTGEAVRFFNPRRDRWTDHFALSSDCSRIIPLTEIGAATERILQLNSAERCLEREVLHQIGRYPPPGITRS